LTPFRARDNVRKGDRADESSAALTSFSPGEDIDAVRPTYQQRFKSFAERMPALKSVQWSCTEVVVWTWTIERRPDQYGHDRVICQDHHRSQGGRRWYLHDCSQGNVNLYRRFGRSASLGCELAFVRSFGELDR
jgi:hypothetical protein